LVKRKVSKTQIIKERSIKKVKKVLEKKGYKEGKLPKRTELHHVKAIAEGGKTTTKNTRVISKAKHTKIHKNRRERSKI
jgi:hypothetical protein